eukprot:TRINITY_DN10760_c0_g1_i1.p4 TRINITY_DN10760_c0_g1~~TRINITY_DN10760_c0_g1_i1.p4  ORF type:complete len:100 (-),score=40.22 TRINITY_DN10760_c0_g1_i1:78-377(-)
MPSHSFVFVCCIFFFFFFKQKTAYEMQRGLVGSEMCIRDSLSTNLLAHNVSVGVGPMYSALIPVSYTHLRAHETSLHLVCRLLLEKKKKKNTTNKDKTM